MTFQTKRKLREKVARLEADLQAYRDEGAESVQRVRDTIRVLNLAEYIEEREHSWLEGVETHYDVDQFLEDIEQGVKYLDELWASDKQGEALRRIGIEQKVLKAAKEGKRIA